MESPPLLSHAKRTPGFRSVKASAVPGRRARNGSLTHSCRLARFLRHIGLRHYLGFGFFAIEDRATGAFIGEAGFHYLRRALASPIGGTMEANWALAGAMQGRGLAEEAMRAALAWAGRHGSGSQITCIIHPDHAASLHIAGKLGFTEVARSVYNNLPVAIPGRPRPGWQPRLKASSSGSAVARTAPGYVARTAPG